MQIGELRVRLGVDADTFKVKDFVSAISNIPLSVAAGISALTGMSFAIGDLIKDTMGLADNLRIFTSITGESGTELQRWMSVAKQVGLNSNLVESGIMSLTKTFQQFKIMGTLPESFQRGLATLGMGFNPNVDQFKFLREAIDRAATRGKRGAEALSMLGLDSSLVGIPTGDKFNKMAVITIDKNGIEAMKELREAFEKFSLVLKQDFYSVLHPAIPVMKDLASALAGFVKYGLLPGAKFGEKIALSTPVKLIAHGLSLFLPGTPLNRQLTGAAYNSVMHVSNYIYTHDDAGTVAAEKLNDVLVSTYRKAVALHKNGIQ